MEKSFYYTVDPEEVDEYKKILDLMNIPYEIEKPIVLLQIGSDQRIIAFPDVPVRLYSMIRKLFKRDGLPYPK
ncbi:hypothetical protein [Brevibacillus migulae]|uniref:hypothetical protein n=1 Tax=Brevibacillus migulae TaxID=1644114 RepID=UPI00106E1E2C|nr:hypothetical protein [Brevibacillus migulae]